MFVYVCKYKPCINFFGTEKRVTVEQDNRKGTRNNNRLVCNDAQFKRSHRSLNNNSNVKNAIRNTSINLSKFSTDARKSYADCSGAQEEQKWSVRF